MLNLPDSDRILDDAERNAIGGPVEVRHEITVERAWLAGAQPLSAAVTYRVDTTAAGPARLQARIAGTAVDLHEPVRLIGVEVPKPWGREIWYTGIEARGESRVVAGDAELPLSLYLSLAPQRLCGRAPLVLLKVLDPLPRPVIGDLYFETHERKQEVYVVTHVDRDAWPDGRGRIRFGMNQTLRARYADDNAFRRDYLQAVRDYERIRRAIDSGEHIDPAIEADARAAMDAFTELRPLSVGDVVVVPTWLPHSLQHGVRVIEFQTPTYERYILSFAQQVLTQDHWDTETAVARMRLEPPPVPAFDAVADGAECIVAFDDFRVWRVTLAPHGRFELPGHPSYALCTVVRGQAAIGALNLAAEEAAFVPGLALHDPILRRRHGQLRNPGPDPAIVLLAAPDL
jgi:hypothetical protein